MRTNGSSEIVTLREEPRKYPKKSFLNASQYSPDPIQPNIRNEFTLGDLALLVVRYATGVEPRNMIGGFEAYELKAD